jgi:dCMP deaminase
MKRIDFDIMMLLICDVISMRSTCVKGHVGSVIVKDGRIISIGYNGMLPSFKNCESVADCPRSNIPSGTKYEIGDCQHAETNAIIFCARTPVSTEGATIYINSTVCRMCARNIISAKISKVVCRSGPYDGTALLTAAGVETVFIDNGLVQQALEELWKDKSANHI